MASQPSIPHEPPDVTLDLHDDPEQIRDAETRLEALGREAEELAEKRQALSPSAEEQLRLETARTTLTAAEERASEAARSIRTGQFQQGGFGEVAFKNAVCAELFDLMSCGDKLSFDVKTFSSFAGTNNPSPIDSGGDLDDSGFAFNPGGQNDIVVIRVFYEWDLIIPIMSKPLANMSGDRRLLQATIAFRNEPFGGS